jgi:hypothetical protein
LSKDLLAVDINNSVLLNTYMDFSFNSKIVPPFLYMNLK